MKIFLPFLLLAIFPLSAEGIRYPWLREPLKYVPADSVQAWAYEGMDFRQMAMACCPNPRIAKNFFTADCNDRRDELAEAWEMFQPQLNIVGGGDDELKDTQGYPAAFVFSNAVPLWRLTGQAALADYMERAVFNAAMRIAHTPAPQRDKDDAEAASAILLLTPGLVYATSEDEKDFYINLYTNCTSRLSLQGERFMLDQITRMPAAGDVKLRLSQLEKPLHFRLHLRLPDWAVRRVGTGLPYKYAGTQPAAPEVWVNGRAVEEVRPDGQGYLVIERDWQRGDEVFIRFALEPQYIRRADSKSGEDIRGAVALQCGPQVYVVTTPTARRYFSVNAPAALSDSVNDKGHHIVCGTMFSTDELRQDAAAPSFSFFAEPYADGAEGSMWGFEYGGKSKP